MPRLAPRACAGHYEGEIFELYVAPTHQGAGLRRAPFRGLPLISSTPSAVRARSSGRLPTTRPRPTSTGGAAAVPWASASSASARQAEEDRLRLGLTGSGDTHRLTHAHSSRTSNAWAELRGPSPMCSAVQQWRICGRASSSSACVAIPRRTSFRSTLRFSDEDRRDGRCGPHGAGARARGRTRHGCTIVGRVERADSPAIGADIGTLAGIGAARRRGQRRRRSTSFAAARAFSISPSPKATVEFAGLAANARIVHVIGTTGLSEPTKRKIAAAARHAPIIKAGNMSLGVNLLVAHDTPRRRSAGRGLRHRDRRDAPPRQGRCALRHRADAGRGRRGRARRRSREALRQGPRRRNRPARSAATSALRACAAAAWSASTG